jgi:hypothetical protein
LIHTEKIKSLVSLTRYLIRHPITGYIMQAILNTLIRILVEYW